MKPTFLEINSEYCEPLKYILRPLILILYNWTFYRHAFIGELILNLFPLLSFSIPLTLNFLNYRYKKKSILFDCVFLHLLSHCPEMKSSNKPRHQ